MILNPDGSFVYTAGAQQTGGDVFFYRARDASGATSAVTRVKLGNSLPVTQSEAVYPPGPGGAVNAAPGQGVPRGLRDLFRR